MSRKTLLFRMLLVFTIALCMVSCAEAEDCLSRQAIAVGANSQLWVLGTYQVGREGNFQPFFWNGNGWDKIDRGFTQIAVLPTGDPVGINNLAEIWQRNRTGWIRMPGTATRIAVGARGQLWVLGSNHVGPNDYQPYFWNGKKWVGIDGALVDLAVLPNGAPVGINSQGQIWQRNKNAWVKMPDTATRIAVGTNGKIWVLGKNHVGSTGDYQPYFWDGEKWVGIDGALIEISVFPSGSLIGANSQGEIWKRTNNTWTRLPGTAAVGC
jgi:hypothetical protein